MLETMRIAGCWQVMYGVENFDSKVLSGTGKAINLEQIHNAIAWTRSAGLEIRLCMMVGNVGETKKTVRENIRLLKKIRPDYLSVAILTPFPGHDIYNWAMPKGLISTFDWNDYYGSVPILLLDTMTPEEVSHAFREMTFSFYFSPHYLLSRLLRIRSIRELLMNINGAFALFRFLMERLWSKHSQQTASQLRIGKEARMDNATLMLLTGNVTPQTSIT
jgi:anaerobic magnesium-protoporphyrin IX monomethyl ester cyclase